MYPKWRTWQYGKTLKISTWEGKILVTMVTMNTIAYSGVLNKIETAVLLELHDKINLSGLLYNAESWNLNKGEEGQLKKTEIKLDPCSLFCSEMGSHISIRGCLSVRRSVCRSIHRSRFRKKSWKWLKLAKMWIQNVYGKIIWIFLHLLVQTRTF